MQRLILGQSRLFRRQQTLVFLILGALKDLENCSPAKQIPMCNRKGISFLRTLRQQPKLTVERDCLIKVLMGFGTSALFL